MNAEKADSALQSAMRDSTQWPSYGRDFSNERFSPLSQINTGNVATLAPVWAYHTGIVSGFETSPVIANGVMYISTSLGHTIALDARSGALLWQYNASAGVNAPPVTYSIDGEQYVAIAAGGNWIVDSPRGDQLLVFRLAAAPAAGAAP